MAGELPDDVRATLSILDQPQNLPPAKLKPTRTMDDIALPVPPQRPQDDLSQTLAILNGNTPPEVDASAPNPRDVEADVLKLALRKGVNSNTALAAHRKAVAQKLNIAPDLVTPQAEESAFYQEHDPADLQKNYPALAKYLGVQGNAELVGKNIDPLKEMETFYRRSENDPAIGMAKGVVSVAQAVVGLGDLVSLGKAGKYVEEKGLDLRKIQSVLNDLYTPESQKLMKEVGDAKGFWNTVGTAVSNPSTIGLMTVESLPQMYLGGRVIGGALKAAFPALSFGAAGAIGEGVTMAGGSAEQIRSSTVTGELTAKQTALSLGVGVLGTGLSALGNKLANKFGFEDVDADVVAGRLLNKLQDSGVPKPLAVRILGGAAIEGGVEEMPQSIVEQVAQNVALDRPWNEGVENAAAIGLVTGGAMGGVFQMGSVRGNQQAVAQETPAEKQARTVVQNTIMKTAAAVRAEDQRNALSEWGKRVATDNTLRKESPESFKDFVRMMADENGAVKEVYVDAKLLNETLAQAGIDQDQLAREMPDVAESLGEALATNGEVRIPIEDYATHIVGTPVESAILDHLRTTPDGMTYAESQVFFQQQQEDFVKQAENLINLNEPVLTRKEFAAQAPEGMQYKDYLQAHKNKIEAFATDLREVRNTLVEGLNSTGRFPKSVSKAYAIPFSQFFAENAARMGILPTELYKSLPLNFAKMQTADILAPSVLSQDEIEKRLVAQHNISVPNLIHADRMGGLAAPSLAITDKAHTFDSFGDITLISSKDMIDPRSGAKVFGADIYSPRYPRVDYAFSKDRVVRLNEQLKDQFALTNEKPIEVYDINGDASDAARTLENNAAVMAAFLESKKIKPKLAKVKKRAIPRWALKYADKTMYSYIDTPAFIEDVAKHTEHIDEILSRAENEEERSLMRRRLANSKAYEIDAYRTDRPNFGKVDPKASLSEMNRQIYDKGLHKEYTSYVYNLTLSMNPTERIFKGFTNSGSGKYIPHTIDNVIAELRKNLRGGENFNYGLGSIRARYTPQFKTLEQIRKAEGKLLSSEDFERVKTELDSEFSAVLEELTRYYKHKGSAGFGLYEIGSQALTDAASLGVPRALKENQFENVPQEAQNRIADFLAKLADVPTEYFEVKLLRQVGLQEFSGAVVPKNAGQNVIDILKKNGITDIKFYKPQDKADRLAKVNEFSNLFFQNAKLPETINVDGIERPTMNSEGRPIYPTEEGIRNFWKWFGDSKVVDDQGRPLVVYRGESGGEHYNEFDRNRTAAGVGFFFAEDIEQAEGYVRRGTKTRGFLLSADKVLDLTDPYSRRNREFMKAYADAFDEWVDRYSGEETDPASMLEAGSLYDYEGTGSGTRWNALFRLAEDMGYNGVRVIDATDGVAAAPVWVVFNPDQIKSAIGNNGDFSNDPNILKQSAFYSALEREIPNLRKVAGKDGSIKTDQAKAWIEARQKEGKFKKEEVEAVGLLDWLDAQEGKVPVADIENFVRENGVQIEETLLGQPSGELNGEPAFYEYDEDNEQYAVYGYQIDSTEYYDSESEAADRVEELNADVPSGETKFESYVLPGGKNYRELLLTLPDVKMQQQTAMNADYRRLSDSVKERLKGHAGFNLYDARDQGKLTPEESDRLTAIDAEAKRIEGLPPPFKSAHFDQPNILAHVRVDERTVGDQRVLFVEEIQSDWAQQGRDKGFAKNETKQWFIAYKGGSTIGPGYASEQEAQTEMKDTFGEREDLEIREGEGERATKLIGTPTGPFVQNTKSWTALAVKRLLRYAAENGFDKIAWTTGEQQAARYDLSKQVDSITVEKKSGKEYDLRVESTEGRTLVDKTVNENELADTVGKELAEKITKQNEGVAVYQGLDLKIGGEGMKAFYDQIVPQVVNEVSKKLGGGKVSLAQFPLDDRAKNDFVKTNKATPGNRYSSTELEEIWLRGSGEPLVQEYLAFRRPLAFGGQHSLDITPELKAKIMQGLPLFQGNRAGFNPSTFTISLLQGADLSSVIHEGAHFYLEALADLAGRENAPQQIKDDFRTTLDWFGITGNEAGVPGGGTLEQKAFHGSPHSFDKFSTANIGTGEGAQAYGYGLYFTDTKDVAEYYKKALSVGRGSQILQDGRNSYSVWGLKNKGDQQISMLEEGMLYGEAVKFKAKWDSENAGKLYEVELKPSEDEYLLWDKPLSEQSDTVKAALQNELRKHITIKSTQDNFADVMYDGEALGSFKENRVPNIVQNIADHIPFSAKDLYKDYANKLGAQKAASDYLHSIGIRGIKYLDGTSRGKGEGSYNYVIFSDSDVGIQAYYQSAKLPETLNIDGVERPTMNSNGKSIYPTEEGVRNFWKWFGDSKVVDEQGRPLVVYHGTTFDNIEHFLPEGGREGDWQKALEHFRKARKANGPYGYMNFRSGTFFSPKADYAGNYTSENTGVMYPVYVRADNPVYKDQASGKTGGVYADKTPDALVQHIEGDINEVATIDPTQIKSAVGNNGAFDPNNPNILRQGGENQQPPGQLPPGATPEEIWSRMTLDQKRPYHEQWAQSYERYTLEGKAPTVEMQSVFSRFREWMLSVYKSMKDFLAQNPLAGKLNDDIRGVFDRLLASEDKIYQAEEARGYASLFGSAAEAGLSETEYENYQNLGKLASIRAIDTLTSRSIRDMRWLSNAKDKTIKKLQAEANSKRAAITEQVTDEVDAMPLNRARNFLTTGEFIDEAGVRRESDTKFKLNEAEVKALSNGNVPENIKGMVSPDGIGLELAAKLLGFQSPETLVDQLVNGESRDVTIQGMTDQKMLEQYGDLTDDKAIERAAEKAIHNDARARFMATGLKLLTKTELSAAQLNRAAKMAAEATIAKKKIRAINPGQFTRAEAKANREVIENVARDPQKAIDAQRAALLNNRLAKAALEAADDVDSILKYFKKFESKGVRKAIGIDQIDQIDDLLQQVDRDKNLPLKEIDKRQALADWVAEQEANGFEPVLDPVQAEQIKAKHYKDMTVDELRMLRDTVKQIEHVGRLQQTLLTEMERADFRARVEEAENSIRTNANRTVEEKGTPTDVIGETNRWVRQMLASHRKFSSFIREMDGGRDGGVMWRLLSKNMNAAGDNEVEMRRASSEAVSDLFKTFQQEKAPLNLYAKRTRVPGTNIAMTQEQRIMFGMNWGNEGNRQRLLDGGIEGKRALSIKEAEAILDTLTKQEWDFIQGVWDHIATYKDQIAALERKITGVEPEWVEPLEVKTKFGTYRGGYFPAKYDTELSTRSESLEAAVDTRMAMKGAFNSAATRKGFTQKRAEAVVNRPLLLSYNVIANHISEVTHRLAWQPWLIDANRVLKALDAPIREHYGAEVLREMRNTVNDIASGDVGSRTPMEKAINYLRSGSTIVGMGWRFSTAFLQPSGLAQSWARIGGRWVAKGVAETFRNLGQANDLVNSKSSLMKNRDITMNREINDVLNRVRTNEGMSAITGSYFSLIGKMQRVVDLPTWFGAYEKALHDMQLENAATAEERARIESDAIALADQAVIDSQSGGQLKDLASIQRGHPGLKLFTNFYSYFSATYNLNIEAVRRTNFRSPTDLAFLAGDLILLNVVPVLFALALKEATKGKCGDDLDCLVKAYGYEQAGYMFGQMILLRDMGSAALVAAGGDQYGYSGPAGLRFFSDLYKAGVQVNQGELDWPLFKSISNTAGVLLHFPTGQINTTLEGIIAVENGDVDGLSILPALLFGPPKD